MSLSLGRTEHDTAILTWTGVGTAGNGMVTVDIPDGVDTWIKLRATNNGQITHTHTHTPTHSHTHIPTAGLSSVAVAESAIRVDRSPPVVASFGSGDDIISNYQHSTDTLCVHATGISDPESGIIQILWQAGITAHKEPLSVPICIVGAHML